jgi:membrane protein implicated in regulation of membrane protease activity
MGVATMSIEWFRDLVICIFGLGATVAVIILVVLAFILYFRTKPLLDSMKATSNTIAKVSSAMEKELAGPLAQVVSFVQGVRQAVGFVNRILKREEED